MGYISMGKQKDIREQLGVAVITKMRADMKLIPPFEPGPEAVCRQGQQLEWLGYDHGDQSQWFGVTQLDPLCRCCWEESHCARQFNYASSNHEILLGRVPLSSRVAQTLLNEVRPWIEPAQSFEKRQLGLGKMFLNSLRLTWVMALLVDTVVLLRAYALIHHPKAAAEMFELLPEQLPLPFNGE
jgi:hypothetical protein